MRLPEAVSYACMTAAVVALSLSAIVCMRADEKAL